MKHWVAISAILLALAVNPPAAGCAEKGSGWNEIGVRIGIESTPKRENFHLYELYAVYGLPWKWRSSSGWGVATQMETSLGALHTSADTGFIGSVGTGLTFDKTGINLAPELGISIDLMDRRHYGRQDFGSILLFGAYIGLAYRFDCGLGIEYRWQHLSNNRILYSNNTPNPGVDMHMIGMSWNF